MTCDNHINLVKLKILQLRSFTELSFNAGGFSSSVSVRDDTVDLLYYIKIATV